MSRSEDRSPPLAQRIRGAEKVVTYLFAPYAPAPDHHACHEDAEPGDGAGHSVPQQRPELGEPVAHDQVPLGHVGALRCGSSLPRTLCDDEPLRVRLANAGHRLILEHFDLERNVKKLRESFEYETSSTLYA